MAELRELLAAAEKADGDRGRRRLDGQGLRRHARLHRGQRSSVCASFRNQDLFDNRHPNYAGDLGVGVGPALGKRLKACDLIIAVGPRLGEATTGGYTLFDLPVPQQKLVHVHAGAEELGRVYQATCPINSGMANFAAAAVR
jgi:acetolactate synthase-1/2/3 large subunit